MKRINPLYLFACIAVGLLLGACVPPEPYHERVEQEVYRGPDYFFHAGMEDFNKGEYGEAIENFEHAIRMRPDYVEAYFYLGQSYEKVQRVEHAERAYGNAISYDPHYLPAREALGLIEFDHKEYREAEKQLDTARSLGSTNPNVFYAIGRIDLSERECRKAIQAFKEAVRLDRDFHEAWEWLEKAEDMCGRGSGEGVHTEKSFKGGGRAISPDNF